MKEHIEILSDNFVDYKGDTHYFVIAAISSELPTDSSQIGMEYGECVSHEVNIYVNNYGTVDYLCDVTKKVCLGIAICNPEDNFNEEIGKKKAIARAKTAKPALLSTKKGYINKHVVQGLLKQEAEYIKNNPHLYIKGYSDMEKAYHKRLQMDEFSLNLNEIEKQIVNKLKEDPDFIKNAIDYLIYKKCQNSQN